MRVELGDTRLDNCWICGCAAKAARSLRNPVCLGILARGVQIEREDGRKIRTTISIDHCLTDIGVGF